MTINLPANWTDLVGLVAAREFDAAADHYKPQLAAWAQNLPTLGDGEFLNAARSAIYNSALANSFRGNWEHDHFKASVCYTEANRRHVAAGHDTDCRGDTLYSRAHAQVMRSHGYEPSPATPCTCGQG